MAYVDFKYINVIYNGLTIDPPSLDGEPGKDYSFTAKTESPPAKARYEWTVDGTPQAIQTNVIKVNTSKAGPHPITCKLYDAAKAGDKAIAEASASLTIKPPAQEQQTDCKSPPPANVLAQLQKTTRFKCMLLKLPGTVEGRGSMNKWVPGFVKAKHFYVPGNSTSVVRTGGVGEPSGSIYAMDIKWSGTSFSGGGSSGYPDKLTGSVCYSNGKVLVSFDYVTNDQTNNLKMSVKNVPCDTGYLMKPKPGGSPELTYLSEEAPVVKGFVTGLEWKSHEERPQGGRQPLVWDASFTDPDWSTGCTFTIDIF